MKQIRCKVLHFKGDIPTETLIAALEAVINRMENEFPAGFERNLEILEPILAGVSYGTRYQSWPEEISFVLAHGEVANDEVFFDHRKYEDIFITTRKSPLGNFSQKEYQQHLVNHAEKILGYCTLLAEELSKELSSIL